MSVILSTFLLLAILIGVLGSLYRLYKVLKAPISRPILITPAAQSRLGVLKYMVIETLTFRTLFKASLSTWVFGWLFHVCLLLMFVIHLRFVAIPAPKLTALLMPHTSLISYGLVIGLGGLFIRRLVVDRVRYVSTLSDYLHVLLLLFIVIIGMFLAASDSVNVYEVTLFIQSLFSIHSTPLSFNFLFILHVLAACVVVVIYPFSKLFHGPLMWFNPTRSQPQRPR